MFPSNENYISGFVKYNRSLLHITQEELAEKAGVGLRFIRELEQGKNSLRMDKVKQVLALFGYGLVPGKDLNPYEINEHFLDKNLRIDLRNKSVLFGSLIEPIREGSEIRSWKFVSTHHAASYKTKPDSSLIIIIPHQDIVKIETPG